MTARGKSAAAGRGLVSAVLLITLAGCGDNGASGTPASPSPSPTETSAASPTDAPTDEPSVEPASGVTKRLNDLTITFPAGWDVERLGGLGLYATDPDSSLNEIAVGGFANQSLAGVDALAKQEMRDSMWEGKPAREDDVVIGGIDAYHLVGPTGLDTTTHVYGGEALAMEFFIKVRTDLPASRQQEFLDSVLATVAFD